MLNCLLVFNRGFSSPTKRSQRMNRKFQSDDAWVFGIVNKGVLVIEERQGLIRALRRLKKEDEIPSLSRDEIEKISHALSVIYSRIHSQTEEILDVTIVGARDVFLRGLSVAIDDFNRAKQVSKHRNLYNRAQFLDRIDSSLVSTRLRKAILNFLKLFMQCFSVDRSSGGFFALSGKYQIDMKDIMLPHVK